MAVDTLDVRFTIKGDIAANWESKNTVLLKNELGIEIGATPDQNKIKIGDGITAWNDLDYTYDLSAIIAKMPTGGKILTVTKTSLDAADSTVLSTIQNPQNGDVAVVKTVVDEIEYELSSYYYSKDDGDWVAITGCVDADKVILRKDIILAGNYTSVGNLNKGSAAGTKSMAVNGKSMMYALEQILSKEEQPTITQEVSAGVTLTGAGAKEVGTTFTPAYTTTFTKGKYSFKPDDTGVTVTAYEISDTNGGSATDASGSFDEFTVEDATNYKITAKLTYSDGVPALTNLENASNPVVKIQGGTITKTSSTVTGYRPMFTYVGTDISVVDGAWIRSKAANKGNTITPGTLTIAEGTKRVLFAIPKSKNKTLKSVIDVDGMGLDVKDNFTHSVQTVAGANGYLGAEYDVWYVDNANGLAATKYTITLG